jgi:DUF1707 SHOCT-like domain
LHRHAVNASGQGCLGRAELRGSVAVVGVACAVRPAGSPLPTVRRTDGGTTVNDPGQPPVPRGELRVSDEDRDATLTALGEHAAAGRLTLDELEQRAGQALTAKTRGDLDVLTRDLPATTTGTTGDVQAAASRRKPIRWIVAIMGGSQRRGRFRLGPAVNVVDIMGGDEIDLRDAEIEGGETTLNMFSLMGGAQVYLPHTVDVEIGGISIMGGNQERGVISRPRPGAPVIRIRSYNIMGGLTIWRLPPEARGLSLKESRRLAKAAERGRLPAPD